MKTEEFYILDSKKASKPYHYRECGLDSIFLMNGFTVEEVDGEEYVSIKNLDGLWKVIGLKICTTAKTISPKEVRFLRRLMNKTQQELASDLRVSDQTVARWEKAECSLDGPADFSLRIHYLLSKTAQPEGIELAEKMLDIMKELIEQDDMSPEYNLVQTNEHWKEADKREYA